MDSIYLDIDSQHRNRINFPNPNNFDIIYSDTINNDVLQTSINPISNAYPIKEWSWNSTPSIQILTSGHQTLVSNGGYGANLYYLGTLLPLQHRINNTSEGSGMTFNILTNPSVVNNILVSGELRIVTYGFGYTEGETLKINRDDLYDENKTTTNISIALQPILMTKGFNTRSGYVNGQTYSTTGGSGSGLTVILTITQYLNDEKIQITKSANGTGYKEGDIITVVGGNNNELNTIRFMLVDIRFRIGDSYSLDVSKINSENTILESSTSTVSHTHCNLEPLQTVSSTSGSGTGMIIATIEEPISQNTDTSNVLLLNKIAYIFEIGQNYKIGDTITIIDRVGKSHELTIVSPNNLIVNKRNIKEIYDNGFFDGTKYTEPDTLSRDFKDIDVYRIFNGEMKYSPYKRYDLNDISNFIKEPLTSIRNITGNKIYLHNTRFFNLGVYDDFYKGLLFEDISAGTKKRIIGYDHKNNIIKVENEINNIHSSLQNFWKITNPSTTTKIFVPNGSDEPKSYVGEIYEAVIHTGQTNNINNFITKEDVTISGVSKTQYKINNKSIDSRIVHQFRNIIDYDPETKMITLDRPLNGITTHANQFGKTLSSISSVNYIHKASNSFENTASDSYHFSLPVFPIELETIGDLTLSSTNKNASGLFINVKITDGIIQKINDIQISQYGSGYESQSLSGSTYTTSSPSTFTNYLTYRSIYSGSY
tara:strand:- start:462 stop:2588 length:2127 start_codon:yes stop_codon:yes gene_type:complete